MLRKRVIASIVLVAGLLLWTGLNILFAQKMGPWMQTYLKYRYNTEISVGSVATNFFNAARFRDVVVTSPVKLRVDEIKLAFRPWAVFTSRGRIRHMFFVHLEHPQFKVEPSQTPKKDIRLPKIFLGFFIHNGEIEAEANGKPIRIAGVKGRAGLTPFALSADFAGKEESFGAFTASLHVVSEQKLPWRARVSLDGVPVDRVSKSILESHPNVGSVEGTVKIAGEATGAVNGKRFIDDYTFDVRSDNFKWTRPTGDTNAIRFNVRAVPGRLEVLNASVNKLIKLNGKIILPFDRAKVRLSARATDAPLVSLVKIVSPKFESDILDGNASFLVDIEGDMKNPKIFGTVTAQPTYAHVRFPETRGQFTVFNNDVNSEFKFANGDAVLKGRIEEKGGVFFTLAANNVSLEAIANENNWKNVRGRLDLNGRWEVSEKRGNLDGNFRLEQFSWGRMKPDRTVEGKLVFNNRLVHLTTTDELFEVKMGISKTMAKLDDVHLNFGKSGRFSASGKAPFGKGEMAISFTATQIPPDMWPPLVSRYPHIQGALDVKGSVKGTFNNPVLAADLNFHELQFLPEGGKWNGSAKLEGQESTFQLKAIEVQGGYTGEVAWSKETGRGEWRAQATLAKADPRLLADVFKSTLAVGGTITGSLGAASQKNFIVGSSTFAWTEGTIGSFSFDRLESILLSKDGTIHLDNVNLIRGAQGVRGEANVRAIPNGWDYSAALQLQHWAQGPAVFDGEIQASGKVLNRFMQVRSDFSSPLLWINDYSFENVAAKLTREDSKWNLKGTSDNGISFDLAMRGAAQNLSGSVHAKSLDLEDVVGRHIAEKKDVPSGIADITATVTGTLAQPKTRISFQTPSIVWRKEEFSASGNFDVNSSSVMVDGAKVTLAKGGTVTLSGGLQLGTTQTMLLNGSGKALDLQATMNLLDWPVHWNGTTDVQFLVSGPPNSHLMDITFQGHHNGFGPFEAGGALSGHVVGANGEWKLGGVRIDAGGGFAKLLEGSQMQFDRNGAGRVHLIIDSRNLQAGHVNLFGGIETTGSWKQKPEDPALPKPPIELDIFARSLWVNQFVLDGNITHLTIKKGDVEFSPIPGTGQQLSGTLVFIDYPTIDVKNFKYVEKGVEKLTLNGLVGPNKWDFLLNMKQADASMLTGILDTALPISGPMDIHLIGQGTPAKPSIQADIVWKDGHIGILPLDTAKCLFTYRNGIVSVTDIEAVKKKGYVMTGTARFGVGDAAEEVEPDVDLTVTKGDFAMLPELWPSITKAHGNFEGKVRITTKSWGRSVSGYFTAEKISMVSAYTPSVTKGELSVRLDKNRLHVEEAHARFGDGDLKLTGYVDFKNGQPNFYNLSLATEKEQGISFRIPELAILPGPVFERFSILKKKLSGVSRGEALVNLMLKGTSDAPVLTGTIELENTVFTYPPPKTAGKGGDHHNTPLTRWAKSFRDKLRWDLTLVAGARTWYQNELVDASVTGTMQFTGLTPELEVNGRVNTEKGSIVYSGSEFRIREAELTIETRSPTLSESDIKETLVYLRAIAEKEVYYTDSLGNGNQETIVMTVDRSLLGEIQPRFYAKNNPNLPSQKALQLALGLPLSDSIDTNSLLPDQRAREAQQRDTDTILRVGLVQLLDSSLASPLARAIARNTGLVDFIRVTYADKDNIADSEAVATTNEPTVSNNTTLRYTKGTKVQFGRELTNRLSADYSFRVDEYQQQVDLRHEVELAYRLKKSLFLRGISELDNERSLGRPPDRRAILENQWRFGLPRKKPTPVPVGEAQPPKQ